MSMMRRAGVWSLFHHQIAGSAGDSALSSGLLILEIRRLNKMVSELLRALRA